MMGDLCPTTLASGRDRFHSARGFSQTSGTSRDSWNLRSAPCEMRGKPSVIDDRAQSSFSCWTLRCTSPDMRQKCFTDGASRNHHPAAKQPVSSRAEGLALTASTESPLAPQRREIMWRSGK